MIVRHYLEARLLVSHVRIWLLKWLETKVLKDQVTKIAYVCRCTGALCYIQHLNLEFLCNGYYLPSCLLQYHFTLCILRWSNGYVGHISEIESLNII